MPVVRKLADWHIPEWVSAGVIVAGVVGLLIYALISLGAPAKDWAKPERFAELEYKIRELIQPVKELGKATAKIDEVVGGTGDETVATPPPAPPARPTVGSMVLDYAQTLGASGLVMFILLFFLLASGDMFLRKTVRVLPRLHDKKAAVEIARQIQQDVSRYLFTVTVINAALGTVVGLALWLVGVPNAPLWGVMVALMNYIPYLGSFVSFGVLLVVGLTSFDTLGRALMPPLIFFGINMIEAYLVTPILVGRRLSMNPVVLFLSLLFWGWIWGVPGALLAVPILVVLKVVCDHVGSLKPLGEFISDENRVSLANGDSKAAA